MPGDPDRPVPGGSLHPPISDHGTGARAPRGGCSRRGAGRHRPAGHVGHRRREGPEGALPLGARRDADRVRGRRPHLRGALRRRLRLSAQAHAAGEDARRHPRGGRGRRGDVARGRAARDRALPGRAAGRARRLHPDTPRDPAAEDPDGGPQLPECRPAARRDTAFPREKLPASTSPTCITGR